MFRSRTPPVLPRHVACVLAGMVLLSSQPGCVHRRMTIRTNPPGAVAYVDDYEIGTTPVSTDFVYYGTRKIRLVKDGCETMTVMQRVRPPWYQVPPLDFVTENLVPCKIRDHRTLDYTLNPQMVVPTEQLLQRAEGLRARSQASAATVPSAPAVMPPPGAGNFAAPPYQGVAPGPPPLGPSPSGPIPPGPPAGGYPVHPLPQ